MLVRKRKARDIFDYKKLQKILIIFWLTSNWANSSVLVRFLNQAYNLKNCTPPILISIMGCCIMKVSAKYSTI